jgi:hypothetical protein
MQPTRRLPVPFLAVGLVAVAACSSPSVSSNPTDATSNPPPSSAAESVAESAAPSEPAELTVTFDGTVPDGWTGGDGEVPVPETEDVIFEMYPDRYVQAANCDLVPEAGVGTSADAIISALSAREGLVVSEPAEVTVDGLTGLQGDISTEAASEAMTCVLDDGSGLVPLFVDDLGGYVAIGPGEKMRTVVLDVPGGTNLVIWLWATPSGDIADYQDAATEVIDGLEIEAS